MEITKAKMITSAVVSKNDYVPYAAEGFRNKTDHVTT